MLKNSLLVGVAKQLRQDSTPAEKKLWDELRGNKFSGIKFRRQMPLVLGVYHYVADFYSAQKKIIVELDGSIHENLELKNYDIDREDILKGAGYRIIRFKNKEVINNIEEVLNKIRSFIK